MSEQDWRANKDVILSWNNARFWPRTEGLKLLKPEALTAKCHVCGQVRFVESFTLFGRVFIEDAWFNVCTKTCDDCAKAMLADAHRHPAFTRDGRLTQQIVKQEEDAAKRRIPWLLRNNDLLVRYGDQGGACAYSGLEFDWSTPWRKPSIDRVDSSRPYSVTNTRWVLNSVSLMKGRMELSEFVGICKAVAQKSGHAG